MSKRGMTGSQCMFIFRFLRKLLTDFHNGCTSLPSHQQFNF
jgi:hypothetical protein